MTFTHTAAVNISYRKCHRACLKGSFERIVNCICQYVNLAMTCQLLAKHIKVRGFTFLCAREVCLTSEYNINDGDDDT